MTEWINEFTRGSGMTKVDLVIVKWMNKFFPSVDQWVVIGSVPIQEGQSIWSRILRFFQCNSWWCVYVCFLYLCVCMQFMLSRVNVFYWHMDAWILPYCYTWKSTGHIQTADCRFSHPECSLRLLSPGLQCNQGQPIAVQHETWHVMNPGWQFVLLMTLRLVGSIDSSCLNSENWVSYDRIENPTNRFQN